ncbi:helix-turn-helix domain-containing protein [Shumkonia mesophila]|uniref:helix-turn-helix domain-containing protein n=1 Tax=Shumkonia mesophila TaxID=2838854 RepID=UPI00293502AA|nr:helix-turn-helix domain-containing protein [Shumkonia mesophila]
MTKETDDLLGEMRALKMLMILQLLRQGVKQSQIAAILGVSEPTMSRMLPKGIARSVSKGGTAFAVEGVE